LTLLQIEAHQSVYSHAVGMSKQFTFTNIAAWNTSYVVQRKIEKKQTSDTIPDTALNALD